MLVRTRYILRGWLTVGRTGWVAWAAESSVAEGWEFAAPLTAKILGAVLWVLILEALRRTGGTAIFVIVLAISLYPVVADVMPGPIRGIGQTLPDTLAYHIVSSESAFGIPMQAFGEIVRSEERRVGKECVSQLRSRW